MTASSALRVERDGPIVRLTLNRPKVGNAIDVEMARQLMYAAIDCDEDDSIRCVILTGEGRFFCTGGDVGSFASAGERIPHLLKELTSYLHSAISRLARMNKPLITVVNGPAAGAGFSLALLGDMTLASDQAHFTLAYSAIGLSPDGGATWLLPKLVGLRRAQELIVTNRRVQAQEAASMGLITRVVALEDLAAEATTLALGISRQAVGAIGLARSLLLSSFSASLETHLEAEARAISAAGRSQEGREGVAALLDKRPAVFEVDR
ncbi:enoyl-CoA hydratase-related protein [soil metagenome]